MPEDPAVHALMEVCIAAGVAVRQAHAAAIKGREEAVKRLPLSQEDVEHLNKLQAAAERLSRSFVAAQRSLARANQVRFRERLEKVTHRIAARLK